MMNLATETPWQSGRLDERSGPRQILFGRMYEDVSIELEAFPTGGRVMCIASAGCTAISLARDHEVVAVDINPRQLAYAAGRIRGEPARAGSVERLMNRMRVLGPVAGWWPERVRTFLDLDDPREQLEYWNRWLDTRTFRLLLNGLLSRTLLRMAYGRRLLDVLPLKMGEVMRQRMIRCFARHSNRTNPYLHSLLLGQMPSQQPPDDPGNIRLVHADAARLLENEPPGSIHGFTLSNILDGADDGYGRRLYAALRRASAPGAVVVIRSFADRDAGSSVNIAERDRSMLWGSVLVTRVSDL